MEVKTTLHICIIGCGYVGLTCGVCFARLGNRVICVDNNPTKIELLRRGVPPVYEPYMEEFLSHSKDNLSFTTEVSAMDSANIVFIAVPTPVSEVGQCDLSQVKQAAKAISQNIKSYKIIVNKCTAIVGTTEDIAKSINQERTPSNHVDVFSVPEFLREGSAISDFLHPHRIIIGGSNNKAIKLLLQLYRPIIEQAFPFHTPSSDAVTTPIPTLFTNGATAEMIKYSSNAFLASKISLINEIGNICKRLGIDVYDVAKGIGLDPRISPHFLEAGLGFGGSCLGKDTRALIGMSRDLDYETILLQAVLEVNKNQPLRMVELARKKLGSLKGKRIAILGTAFKAETDDMRESSAIPVVEQLLEEGAFPILYDPTALKNAKAIFRDRVSYGRNIKETIAESDCVFIVTAWEEFKDRELYKGKIVIDGRRTIETIESMDYDRLC